MWRHPSLTVPVNSRRRNDNDVMMTQTHLDSDATVLYAGVLKIKSRLLAVSVFYGRCSSSRASSLTLLPFLRLVRLQLIVVLILYVLFSFENSRSSVIARS